MPPEKLSRVTSYDWAVSLGLMPLGCVLAGPVAEALGPSEVPLVGSLLSTFALALGLLPRETRMLERLEGRPAPVAAADPIAWAPDRLDEQPQRAERLETARERVPVA